MSTTGNHPPERSIGQIVSDATADVSTIVRSEIELAKLEIKNDVTHVGKGIGMFAAAGVLALFAFGILLLGAAWGLEAGTALPLWASLLIVAGVLFLITAILALVGKSALGKVKGKPEKTIHHGQKTVESVKESATSSNPKATQTNAAQGADAKS